jgi:hypothetical protein
MLTIKWSWFRRPPWTSPTRYPLKGYIIRAEEVPCPILSVPWVVHKLSRLGFIIVLIVNEATHRTDDLLLLLVEHLLKELAPVELGFLIVESLYSEDGLGSNWAR